MKWVHILLVFLVFLLVVYLIHTKREYACNDFCSSLDDCSQNQLCTVCEPTTHKCIQPSQTSISSSNPTTTNSTSSDYVYISSFSLISIAFFFTSILKCCTRVDSTLNQPLLPTTVPENSNLDQTPNIGSTSSSDMGSTSSSDMGSTSSQNTGPTSSGLVHYLILILEIQL